jgi:hypothetical protein
MTQRVRKGETQMIRILIIACFLGVAFLFVVGCEDTQEKMRTYEIKTRMLGDRQIFIIDKLCVDDADQTAIIYLSKVVDADGIYPEARFYFCDQDGIRIDTLSNTDESFATEGVGYKGKITCPVPEKTARVDVDIAPRKALVMDDFSHIQPGMTMAEVRQALGWPQKQDRSTYVYITREFGTVRVFFDENDCVSRIESIGLAGDNP